MLKGAVASVAGLTVVGAPVGVKLAKPPGLWTPRGLVLPWPTRAIVSAEEVPTYILPPIIVTPPYGTMEGDYNYGGGISGGGIGQSQFGSMIYQRVLRQRSIEAQQAQRQAIADQWTALYNAWLEQFGPDAARIATELQWAGLEATKVIAVVAVLEAAASAIEAGGYIFNQTRNIVPFIAEGMRNAGLLAQIAGLTVGFAVYLSGAVAVLAGLALIYIVVTRMTSAEVGTNYVGLRTTDGNPDLIFEVEAP